jgi:hypothetical protein
MNCRISLQHGMLRLRFWWTGYDALTNGHNACYATPAYMAHVGELLARKHLNARPERLKKGDTATKGGKQHVIYPV